MKENNMFKTTTHICNICEAIGILDIKDTDINCDQNGCQGIMIADDKLMEQVSKEFMSADITDKDPSCPKCEEIYQPDMEKCPTCGCRNPLKLIELIY